MTTKKFLDADGVTYLWGRIKTEIEGIDLSSKQDKLNDTQLAKLNDTTEYATKSELSNVGKVKTVNTISPDSDGNITIATDDGDVAVSLVNEMFNGEEISESTASLYYTKAEIDTKLGNIETILASI